MGVKEDTEDLENVGMVVVAVESNELDDIAAVSGDVVSFDFNREIEAC